LEYTGRIETIPPAENEFSIPDSGLAQGRSLAQQFSPGKGFMYLMFHYRINVLAHGLPDLLN